MKEKMVKLEIFIPEEFLQPLRQALGEIKVGVIGNYDHCLSVIDVKGYWRPLADATPYDGERGKISEGTECKVEVNCAENLIPLALKTIRSIHPYETPLINILPLLNDSYE